MRLQKIIPLLLIFSNVVSRVFSADSTLTNDAVAKNLDDNNKVKVNAVEVIHAADSSTPTNDAVANLDDNEVKVKTVEVLHEELYGLAMQVVMQNMMNPKTGTAITGGRKLSLTVDADGCATGTEAEVKGWCDADTSRDCCTGSFACDDWSADATYTICPGACRGSFSCFSLAAKAPDGSTVKVGRDACVGQNACSIFAEANYADDTIATIDIGSQSCSADFACEYVASFSSQTSPRTITVPSNECSGSNAVCKECVRNPSDATANPLLITTQCCEGKGGASGDSHSECGVAPTPASSAGGDPHFYMFHSHLVTFQGACDVVLSKSSSGADGFAFHIHARLTSPASNDSLKENREKYTYISNISILIEGEGTTQYMFQFGTETEKGAPVKLNGQHFASAHDTDAQVVEASSGLPFSITRVIIGQRGNIVLYTIGFKNGSKIVIRANLHFKMLFIDMEGHFGGSHVTGLLGDIFKKGLFNRKGELMSDDDVDSYGNEWQVRDDELNIFIEKDRQPQFPSKCLIVNADDNKEESNTNLRGDKGASSTARRRRLLEVTSGAGMTAFEKDAIAACDHLKGRGVQVCIHDVLAVQNIEVASDPFYASIV